MALQDYMNLPSDANGNLTPDQINQAFRDTYGIDAPPNVIQDFAGHVGAGPHFYERVAKGDFANETQSRDPGYFQRAQVAKLAEEQINLNKQYNAPLIPAQEASKSALQSRYDAILSDLTNRETTDTTNLTRSTSAEFAKRGIPLTSDAYTRELAGQLTPIHAQYGTQRATQNADLQTGLNSIDQAIAQLKAGNPSTSIAAANTLFPSVETAKQNQDIFSNISLPESQQKITTAQQNTPTAIATAYRNLLDVNKQLGNG